MIFCVVSIGIINRLGSTIDFNISSTFISLSASMDIHIIVGINISPTTTEVNESQQHQGNNNIMQW